MWLVDVGGFNLSRLSMTSSGSLVSCFFFSAKFSLGFPQLTAADSGDGTCAFDPDPSAGGVHQSPAHKYTGERMERHLMAPRLL